MTVSAHDLDILARTVYGEARGEPEASRQGVAFVAINRARIAAKTGRKQFGDGSIATACLAPFQFSSWNPNDPNRPQMLAVTLDDPVFQECFYIALQAVLGKVSDPSQGATFYWANSIPTPAWAQGKDYVSLGHHRFICDA